MEFRRVSLKVSSLVCYSQIHRPRSLLRNQVNTNNGTVLLAEFPICETLWRRCGQHLPCAPALQFWGTQKRLRSVLMVQDELPKRHTHSLLLSHCPGCGNKHDRLGGWKDRHLLLTVPEAAGRDQRASLVGIWWGPPPRLTDAALLLCPCVSDGGSPGVSSSSYKDMNPIMGGSTLVTSSKPDPLPRASHPDTTALGWGIDIWI